MNIQVEFSLEELAELEAALVYAKRIKGKIMLARKELAEKIEEHERSERIRNEKMDMR